MDGYVECLVKAKPNTLAKVGKAALIVLAVIMALLLFMTMSWFFMILAIAAGAGAYFVGMYTEVEYEYLYLDKEITVDKVYNQSRRKRAGVYSLDKVEIFAPIKSYHLDNFGKREGKVTDYSIGYEDQPDLRYVMYYEGGEKFLFSPSPEMVKAMKSQSPRKVFSD
ncbi:MAG: hypothetical protein IKS07_06235 [Lachnospiraceae bacterium]|nr:hypothetical protein [Lachnospiraceae bacterium]MCR5477306.1 DUF6106 family protein [Lachnospiraceae bacterium]